MHEALIKFKTEWLLVITITIIICIVYASIMGFEDVPLSAFVLAPLRKQIHNKLSYDKWQEKTILENLILRTCTHTNAAHPIQHDINDNIPLLMMIKKVQCHKENVNIHHRFISIRISPPSHAYHHYFYYSLTCCCCNYSPKISIFQSLLLCLLHHIYFLGSHALFKSRK